MSDTTSVPNINGTPLNIFQLSTTSPLDILNTNSGSTSAIGLDNFCYYIEDGVALSTPQFLWCGYTGSNSISIPKNPLPGDVNITSVVNNFLTGDTTLQNILKTNLTEWNYKNLNEKEEEAITTAPPCKCKPDNFKNVFNIGVRAVQVVRTDFGPSQIYEDCCFQNGNQQSLANDDSAKYFYSKNGNLIETCPFEYRSISSPSCYPKFEDRCLSGSDINKDTIGQKWSQSADGQINCLDAFRQIVSSDENLSSEYTDPSKQIYNPIPQIVDPNLIRNPSKAKLLVSKLFSVINQNKIDITASVDSPDYNPISDTLYAICKDYPFTCKDNLDSFCSNDNTFTLMNNPNRLRWCGCHMPDSGYGKYTDVYNIPKECSPVCKKDFVIPDVENTLLGSVLQCKNKDLCIIDDVNISFLRGGNLNISQVCGECVNGGSCQCAIENDAFISGGDVNISQVCGQFEYYNTDYNFLTGYTKFEIGQSDSNNKIWYLSIVLLVLIVMVMIGYLRK